MQPQSAETPITSLSGSDADIIAAAEARAAFWKYAPDARYTVTVRLPGKPLREVVVTHDAEDHFIIRR
jgi:hypothetical protein